MDLNSQAWYGIVFSRKSHVGILSSSTSECDLIWSKGLERDNQVQIKALKWFSVQDDQCLIPRGKVVTEAAQKEDVKRHGKDSVSTASREAWG